MVWSSSRFSWKIVIFLNHFLSKHYGECRMACKCLRNLCVFLEILHRLVRLLNRFEFYFVLQRSKHATKIFSFFFCLWLNGRSLAMYGYIYFLSFFFLYILEVHLISVCVCVCAAAGCGMLRVGYDCRMMMVVVFFFIFIPSYMM